jgi:hypothetical protein
MSTQRLLRSNGSLLDVSSTAQKMCELAARYFCNVHLLFCDPRFLIIMNFRLDSGDLESIKVLVANGASCSVGNDDLRTVNSHRERRFDPAQHGFGLSV